MKWYKFEERHMFKVLTVLGTNFGPFAWITVNDVKPRGTAGS